VEVHTTKHKQTKKSVFGKVLQKNKKCKMEFQFFFKKTFSNEFFFLSKKAGAGSGWIFKMDFLER
jgi:hypothetical protein